MGYVLPTQQQQALINAAKGWHFPLTRQLSRVRDSSWGIKVRTFLIESTLRTVNREFLLHLATFLFSYAHFLGDVAKVLAKCRESKLERTCIHVPRHASND